MIKLPKKDGEYYLILEPDGDIVTPILKADYLPYKKEDWILTELIDKRTEHLNEKKEKYKIQSELCFATYKNTNTNYLILISNIYKLHKNVSILPIVDFDWESY